MKRLFISVCGLVSVLQLSAQERVMSFDDALQMMFEQNEAVRAAKFGVRAAEQERRAAIGLRLPTIAVSGAYALLDDDVAIDLNGVKGRVLKGAESILPALDPALGQVLQGVITPFAGQNWEHSLQSRNLASIGGSVTLPIFTGGRINVANRAARIGEKMANSELEGVQNGLTTQLVERYFGLQLARHAVEVRRQVVDGIARHLADAEALEQNGMIAASERLYVEYKAAEAERDLQKAILTAQTAQEALENTLGGASALPVTAMFVLDNLEDIEYFRRTAVANNELLQQALLQQGLARENVRLQRAEFFPQVAAMGAASFYNWQVSSLVPRWAVGVGATFKIFDGLTREYRYSAARQTLRSVESLVLKAERDILLLVDNSYAEMLNERNLLQSLEASMNFAQEYLRIKRAAFLEGMSTSSDLIDAELNLAKVRVERLEAAYKFDLALARLLEVAGISADFSNYINRTDARAITF